MTQSSADPMILYGQLLSDLQALASISEEQSRRGGEMKPTELQDSMNVCGAIIDRVRDVDERIAKAGVRPGDPRLATAAEQARQLVSTIVLNFARTADRMRQFREGSLANLQSMTSGVRVANAYGGLPQERAPQILERRA
ncbi:MAG: hypothetical protein HYX75_21655 [Acidobacteria bacterium]|nr:hypothetical protein [Acidobacteriota bacterium]